MNQKIVPLLIIILVVVSFLAGVLYTKSKNLEQANIVGPSATPTSPQPLSTDNLKKYASDLGLNTSQFNQCLDSSSKASKVREDQAYGNSLGVQGTPAFFINGRFLGGAFPYELFKEIIDKELAGQGSNNPKDYSSTLQDAAKTQQGQPPAFIAKAVKVDVKPGDPVKGQTDAKVTIIEFSDFQCPYCIRASTTVSQLMSEYGDKVRLVFKQYPLPSHPFAQKAAEASLCAADQGKFWEYEDKVWGSER